MHWLLYQVLGLLGSIFASSFIFLAPRIAVGDDVSLTITKFIMGVMYPILFIGIYIYFDTIKNSFSEIDPYYNNLTKFGALYTFLQLYFNLNAPDSVDDMHYRETMEQYFYENIFWLICLFSSRMEMFNDVGNSYLVDLYYEDPYTLLSSLCILGAQLLFFRYTLRPHWTPFMLAFVFQNTLEYSCIQAVFRPEDGNPHLAWKKILIQLEWGFSTPEEVQSTVEENFLNNVFNNFENLDEEARLNFLKFLFYVIKFKEVRSYLGKFEEFWLYLAHNILLKNDEQNMEHKKKLSKISLKIISEVFQYWPSVKIKKLPNLDSITVRAMNVLQTYKPHFLVDNFPSVVNHLLIKIVAGQKFIFKKEFLQLFQKDQRNKVQKFLMKHKTKIDEEIETLEAFRNENIPKIPTIKCGFCKKDKLDLHNRKLKYCTKCKSIWYCSTKCQKKHWSKHKEKCKKLLWKN